MVELAARSALPSTDAAPRRPAAVPATAGTSTSLRRSAREVVAALPRVSGLDSWYLGRVDGETLLPLAVSDEAQGVRVGQRLQWSAAVCRRMVNGLGPAVAPDVAAVPNYARAPYAISLGMTAYAGVPVRAGDGALLGVLAGWNVRPTAALADGLEPLAHAFAGLLSQSLEAEVRADAALREQEAERLRRENADRVTALSSRAGWGALLRQEDLRSAERGLPVVVLLVDLGRVRSSARLQRGTDLVVRALPRAVVARLTARQFGAVLPGADAAEAADRAAALSTVLRATGYAATTAWATSAEAEDLRAVWHVAEERLYRARRDGEGS
ncbi:GAF domain-containing protein [Kineococcus terrestris]|uniref:GAF domain-containing protein n=1 Tax=Kineococcus terrestris TaxID=2044856 RepID=UPI0034DAC47B